MSRLNTRMRRWGVVLRIASRDARQSFGRTLTAVILISLPIIVAIGSITFWDVTTSQRYQASSWLGHTSDVQAVTLRRSSTALDQDITADVLSKTASDDEIDVTMETLTNWVPDGDHLIAVDTLYQLHLTAPDGTGFTVDSGTQTASLDAPRVAAGGQHGGLAANHAVLSDDAARSLGVQVGDTVSLTLTVAKERTTQELEGSAVIDAIIGGSEPGDHRRRHARHRSPRGGRAHPDGLVRDGSRPRLVGQGPRDQRLRLLGRLARCPGQPAGCLCRCPHRSPNTSYLSPR